MTENINSGGKPLTFCWRIYKNFILLVIITAGFLIGGVIFYINYQEKKTEGLKILSSQEVGEKALNYINKNILKGQTTASLKEIKEENGFYKILIKINDQEFSSYATRDGKFLFPEVIDLEAKTAVQPETPTSEEKPAKSKEELEAFAKCLTEKGMKFYGAHWCHWCKEEKELFGEAVEYLPYIECIDKTTNQMTAECQKIGITGFPTWILPNGEKLSGFKSLEELAKLSGCQL